MTQAAVLASNASLMTTPSGTAPVYLARAWVNFNGTGTVAIRASGNVSSITDNGTGLYTVNFTTAMTNANYSVVGTQGHTSSTGWVIDSYTNKTTSGSQIATTNAAGAVQDSTSVNVAIFR